LAEGNAGNTEKNESNNFTKLSTIVVLLKFKFEVKKSFDNFIIKNKKTVNASPVKTSILKIFLFKIILSSATVFINKIKIKIINVDFVFVINISRKSGTFEFSAVKITEKTEIIKTGLIIYAGYKINI